MNQPLQYRIGLFLNQFGNNFVAHGKDITIAAKIISFGSIEYKNP